MLFHVLGTVEVDGADQTGLRARKPRTLLAALLLRSNSWVTLDELVAAIWEGTPPASAERNVTTYVWQLRKALANRAGLQDGAATRIDGRSGAYRIRIEADELDRDVFERQTRAGIEALNDDDPHSAIDHLHRAVGLWRGRPFDGLDTEAARVEAARLGEVHWSAREALADAFGAAGRGAEQISLLTALTAEDPLRETPWCRLLLALARAGRPADALAAYQRARDRLIDELGVEPGPHLRRVHREILAGGGSDEQSHDTVSDRRGTPQAALLGRLREVPGPTFDVWAAAALTDSDPDVVAVHLAALAADGSLEARPGERYALVAAPSAGTASLAGTSAAVTARPAAERPARDRLATYYAHVALEAAGAVSGEKLRDVAATTPVPSFADVPAAAQWLADERDTLLAAAAAYAEQGRVGPAWRIVRAVQTHVDAVGAPEGWTALLDRVAEAARAAGDAQGELVVRNALGIAHWRNGAHDVALRELVTALRVAEGGADARTVATMLLNLAEAHESLDRVVEAGDLLARAETLLQDLDSPALSAIAADCRIRLHHAAVQRAGAGVLYRRWTHAVPPTGRLGA